MTVSPKQLEDNLKRKSAQEIQALEQRIDDLLEEGVKKNGNAQNSIYIDASTLKPGSNYTIQQLIANYRQAGWSVQQESDQREGDYLIFQAKSYVTQSGSSDQREAQYSQEG
jgi:hypothetical protein